MVKTDDFIMEGSADFDLKEKEIIGEDDEAMHANWLAHHRSKSAGLKYAEYESDESGRIPNSKMNSSVEDDVDDRRIRRQIANCNERRRMQSINAGFQALRHLLPRKDGDKMSKASILAATADFIQSLMRERSKMLEENAVSATKRRRLDVGEQNGALTIDEIPVNVIECIKTIGELRDMLQKETQLRLTYEKELLELRNKMRSFPLVRGDNEFSPKSSISSNGDNRNLLIELAARQQEKQLYCPTPIASSEVNILSSAIASLAKSSPGASQPGGGLLSAPIGISSQQAFAIPPMGQQGSSLFAAVGHQNHSNGLSSQQQAPDNSAASISQRNLQALVLAIRHLEGASSGNANGSLVMH